MSSIVYKIVSFSFAIDYIALEYVREFLSIYRDLYSNSKIEKILICSKIENVGGYTVEELEYIRTEIKEYQKYMNRVLKKLNHRAYSENIEFGMDESMKDFITVLHLKLNKVGCSQ